MYYNYQQKPQVALKRLQSNNIFYSAPSIDTPC